MSKEAEKLRQSVIYSIGFISVLWLIKFYEMGTDSDLSFLGILPRTLKGSLGIITSPLIHGNFAHLLSNTFPLLLLTAGVVYFYNRIAFQVVSIIYLLTGIWVWIVAREAYHIGASGLVYGLVTFLFFSGIFRKDASSVALSLIVIFLYGGMLYGLVPTDSGVSYESHIVGAVTGMLIAFYFRKKHTMTIKTYDWMEEEEESENANTTYEMNLKYRYRDEDKND
jgi:membrane associated rhomboid family serine protease